MQMILPHLALGMGGMHKVVNSKIVTNLLLPKQGLILSTLQNGIQIFTDVRDYNGRMLILFGTPDPKIVWVCRTLLHSGDVFIDIGANYGTVGLLCHDIVGSGGAVHLFEPQPELCSRIRDCLQRHSLSNVYLHEVGLLDRHGFLELNCVPGHSGAASFVRDFREKNPVKVPIRDIKKQIPPLVLNHPVSVKLDVEGAELVLLKFLVTLQNMRFMVFEHRGVLEHLEIWNMMEKAGLFLYGILKKALRAPILKLVRTPDEIIGYEDLVASREPLSIDIP